MLLGNMYFAIVRITLLISIPFVSLLGIASPQSNQEKPIIAPKEMVEKVDIGKIGEKRVYKKIIAFSLLGGFVLLSSGFFILLREANRGFGLILCCEKVCDREKLVNAFRKWKQYHREIEENQNQELDIFEMKKEDVSRIFRKKSLQLHPDKSPENLDGEKQKELLNEKNLLIAFSERREKCMERFCNFCEELGTFASPNEREEMMALICELPCLVRYVVRCEEDRVRRVLERTGEEVEKRGRQEEGYFGCRPRRLAICAPPSPRQGLM